MNFLKKLFSPAPASQRKHYYTFSAKCKRCGETLEGRIDLDNDLSVEYEGGSDTYYVRKVLIGEKRCFQQVEVHFKFSAGKQLLEREIVGGEFIG